MIYFVFALIVAAALLYLIFSEGRTLRQGVTQALSELTRLKERAKSIKASLKDIEYEKSVGKMDEENANRLTQELLSEWDLIEKKITGLENASATQKVQQENCPQCGTKILTASAKFCHSCGTKFSILILAVATFLFFPEYSFAYDIHVTIQNSTHERVETAPLNVQLLKLAQGMEPVTAQKAVQGKANFLNLPEMAGAPYMLQVVYRGVAYNRVIPPNTQSPASVNLEVFDPTSSTEKLRVRTLVELRRTQEKELSGIIILFFLNTGKSAFVGGGGGLEFALPPNAKVEQASISVGSGGSNIEWLKLNPEKTQRAGVYAIGQNIKPGDRVMQATFKIPYDIKKTLVEFQSVYPQDTGLQLIVEPEDVVVKQGEKTLSRHEDKNLGRKLISFGANQKNVSLALSGGGIAEHIKNEEVEVVVKSPLTLTQKILFPLVAVLIFLVGFLAMARRKIA